MNKSNKETTSAKVQSSSKVDAIATTVDVNRNNITTINDIFIENKRGNSLDNNYLLEKNNVDVCRYDTHKYHVTSEKYRILAKWLTDYNKFVSGKEKIDSKQAKANSEAVDPEDIMKNNNVFDILNTSLQESTSTFKFENDNKKNIQNTNNGIPLKRDSFTADSKLSNHTSSDVFKNNNISSKRKKLICAVVLVCSFIAVSAILIGVFVGTFASSDQTSSCNNSNCSVGYTSVLMKNKCVCVDINECRNDSVCKSYEICQNSVGSYKCVNASNDEYCMISCYSPNKCSKKNDTYMCDCALGFLQLNDTNATKCVDIDECALNSTLYSCSPTDKCKNTNGSYECCSQFSSKNDTSCYTCGHQYEKPIMRIYGGVSAQPNSWPWMVLIAMNFQYGANKWLNITSLCGGALISNNYIITAAHCVAKKKISYNNIAIHIQENAYHPTYESIYTTYIGIYNQTSDTQIPENMYQLESIIVHPDYDASSLTNDIAILKLARPVQRSIQKDWICIDNSQQFNVSNISSKVYVIGFGMIDRLLGTPTDVLRQVDLNIYPFSTCSTVTDTRVVNESSQLCVGNILGGKDSCNGDSGSPLMYLHNERWYMIGVVSYGKGCGEANKPGVYTRVSYFYDWIKLIVA